MMISRQNYESYLIDFLDGSLSEEEQKIVLDFLDHNPDLYDEFMALQNEAFILDTDIVYPDKNLLKKPVITALGSINENNYQEYFIAALENDADEKTLALLDRFLALNPELENDFKQSGLLKLKADQSIEYPNKKKLYKRQKPIYAFNLSSYRWQVAAAITFLIAFAWSVNHFYNPHQNTDREYFIGKSMDYLPIQLLDQPSSISVEFALKNLPAINNLGSSSDQEEMMTELAEMRQSPPIFMNHIEADLSIYADASPSYLLPNMLPIEIYYANRLAEEIAYAEPSRVNTPLNALSRLTTNIFGKKESRPKKEKDALWTIASWGITRLYGASNNDVRIAKENNNEEGYTYYSIDSQIFSYHKKKKNKK